jgi:hypothetical protein
MIYIGRRRRGGVRARVFAVHRGQCIISYHKLGLGGIEQCTQFAPDPSSDTASRHRNIRCLYFSFFDITIHGYFGIVRRDDHRIGLSGGVHLSSQYCGDRVAILKHDEQNLKRSFGIHPCASLGRSSYAQSCPYRLSKKGAHSSGLSLVARRMSLAMLLQVSPRHARSTRER